MKVLTEMELRAKWKTPEDGVYHVEAGTFVTPMAKDFLREKGVSMVIDPEEKKSMTRTPVKKQGDHTYIDAKTGEGYREKPENMTHLRGNLLVMKTHPRIAFRGKVDTIQAKVLLLMAEYRNEPGLYKDLADILNGLREVLGSEGKEEEIAGFSLFGLDEKEIHRMSHQVRETFGMDHPIPDASMGKTALELNLLRAEIREVELAAANAFEDEENDYGIIKALNRLSSGVYVVFCRLLSGYYDRMEE